MLKISFPSVKRDFKVLDLIHLDICEFNDMLTPGGKTYFITSIDDCIDACMYIC